MGNLPEVETLLFLAEQLDIPIHGNLFSLGKISFFSNAIPNTARNQNLTPAIGNDDSYRASSSRGGADIDFAVEEIGAVDDIGEAQSLFADRCLIEAFSIIAYRQFYLAMTGAKTDADRIGAGMLDNIIDLLLDDAKQHQLHIVRHPYFRKELVIELDCKRVCALE